MVEDKKKLLGVNSKRGAAGNAKTGLDFLGFNYA
jgi:hypothetical protein